MREECYSKLRDAVPSQNIENIECCFSCQEEMVRVTNLMISTAFSNRFLSEISSLDDALQEVSLVLQRLASIYHLLGAKLMSYMMEETRGIIFQHYDPLLPVWNSELRMVYEGNTQMVDELRIFLAKLKVHGHTGLRSFVKSNIRETGLAGVLDQLERLLGEEWRMLAEENDRDASRSEVSEDFKSGVASNTTGRGKKSGRKPEEGKIEEKLPNNIKNDPENQTIKEELFEQKEEDNTDNDSPLDSFLIVDSPDVRIWISKQIGERNN